MRKLDISDEERKIKKWRWDYLSKYKSATNDDWQHYLDATHCEICGEKFAPRRGNPRGKMPKTSKCQDHDHRTNKIRGVICLNCNTMEGHAKTSERAYQVACYMAEYTPLMELIKQAQGDINGSPQI